jgi:CheY-like chemotaxis protein
MMSSSNRNENGPTILLVEDSADSRTLFETVLGNAGYHVVSTDNGQAAMSYLQEERANRRPLPALVITDLNMPHLDGLQLITALKHDPSLATLPVIAMSGSSPTSLYLAALAAPILRGMPHGEPDVRPGRSGGVVASFRKPVRDNFKAILAVVERHAGKTGNGS